ncbi:MAG: bifunctional phosphoglucose/phosphomannose isomerase [Flavobacteriales bacterium]|nr:bifunctional phosphoglucose/phosphomannose isomerase [Flavobacteriales bacterium]
MVMRDFIKEFPNHITDALHISESLSLYEKYFLKQTFSNIVISGQGGSAIGGVIIKDLLQDYIQIPIIVNKDYSIPAFINKNTLFIASSYSGNTEETISALNKVIDLQKSGEKIIIFCICSGGQILEIAKKHELKHILIPEGGAPRAMLCYSIVQMLTVISMISSKTDFVKNKLNAVKDYLINNQNSIIQLAHACAEKLNNKMPFLYTFSNFEGVALRFKQQLNENAKRHATYNLIPEMNHNEIVAWNKKNICVSPVFINGNSSERNKKRMMINIEQIKKSVENVVELTCGESDSFIQYFHFIHLVDWVSLILAEKDGVDPNNIDPINYLKEELKKV